MKTQIKQARRLATGMGWRIERAGSGHEKWLPPDGRPMVLVSATPSDVRAWKNTRADLRRSGLPV